MTASKRLTTSFICRAGLAVGGVVLIAVGAHALLIARFAEARFRAELEMLARRGAVQVRDAADSEEPAFRAWAWSSLQDADIVQVSLRDDQGSPLMVAPGEVAGLPAALPPLSGVSWTRGIEAMDGTPSRSLWEAAAPLPRADGGAADRYVVILARRMSWRGVSRVGVLGFAALLGAVGGVGVAALTAWFGRRVRRPLAAIMAGGVPSHARGAEVPPGETGDEVAALVQWADELGERTRRAEERAERAERHVHSRVAQETRRISLMLRRAERTAWLDPLTQLGNRRLLDDRLEALFAAHRDDEIDLAVVMMDLDNFKQLNDSRGHTAGDDLLEFLGELLRGSLRPNDLGIRYGGDEFALVLPGSDAEQASQIAERIARLFGQRTSVMKLETQVTLSAGVASLNRDRPETAKQLLELADRALYAAKCGRTALSASS